MATIKGKWVFNFTELDASPTPYQEVNFTSNSTQYTDMYFESLELLYNHFTVYNNFEKSWVNEAYRTVDFGSTEQEVSDEFLTWMQANAIQQVEEETKPTVTISYNNTTIASIEAGKTATLHCADKKMSTDIVITAPEIEDVKLQEKTITENCEAIPDEGYSGFSKVTVNVPIPDGYIDPEGTKEITENGTYDITEFESINVNISAPVPVYYDGTVTISGGETLISFTINDIDSNTYTGTYTAIDGVTWAEWCASEYNTVDFEIVDNLVTADGDAIATVQDSDYVSVLATDVIISGYEYYYSINPK